MDNEEIIRLKELSITHRRRLHVLEIKAAFSGSNTAPEILLEIEDIQSSIDKIEREMLILQQHYPPDNKFDREIANKEVHVAYEEKQTVAVVFTGDLNDESGLRNAIVALIADIVDVPREYVEIIDISSGRIVVTIRMPRSAVSKLTYLFKKQPELFSKHIEKIELIGDTHAPLLNAQDLSRAKGSTMSVSIKNSRQVFIVHGHNVKARDAMSQFLRAVNLQPLTWGEASRLIEPNNSDPVEIVKKGLETSQAAIILFTPDEYVRVRPYLATILGSKHEGFQPRSDVILEAGVALGIAPERTILVHIGEAREISRMRSGNYLHLTNNADQRLDLIECLKHAGCDVKTNNDFANVSIAGDFDAVVKPEYTEPRLLEVSIYNGTKSIFHAGMSYLREKSREDVIIYAPTGVWDYLLEKQEWFATIAGCLARGLNKTYQPYADMTVPTKLDSFYGVYGMPPRLKNDTKKEHDRLIRDLNTVKRLFKCFEGLETAHMYYLDTDPDDIPGTGVIIIDDMALSLAYAVNGRFRVDYAINILDREITKELRNWFNKHVLPIPLRNSNIIQEVKAGITASQGMNNVIHRYANDKSRFEQLNTQQTI